MIRRCVLWAVLAGLIPFEGSAQDVRVGAKAETYRFESPELVGADQAQLVSVPVGVTWGRSFVGIAVEGAYARGIVTFSDGSSAEITGWTDTRIAASASWKMFTARAFATLGTGESQYHAAEMPLLGVLGSDLLPFSLRAWGTGGAAGGELQLSGSHRGLDLSLAGGYVAPREHAPFASAGATYRPSPEVRLRGTVARSFGTASNVSLMAGYQLFQEEAVGGVDVFAPGARWEAQLALAHPIGARESLLMYAGVFARSASEITFPGPVESLIPGILGSAARRTVAAGIEMHATRSRFALFPEAHVRMLASDDDRSGGWLGTVGLAADWRVAGGSFVDRLIATPRARAYFGSADVASSTTGVSGWEAGITLRWERGGR